jgi:hypothetical protein
LEIIYSILEIGFNNIKMKERVLPKKNVLKQLPSKEVRALLLKSINDLPVTGGYSEGGYTEGYY